VQDLSEASNRGVLYVPGSSVPTSAEPGDAPSRKSAASWSEVPWRTILATVGVVVATYALIIVVLAEQRIVMWVLLAGFMAVVLAPLVTRVEGRLGGRRALAAGVVMIATLLIIVGTVALFVMPVRTQLVNIITDLPGEGSYPITATSFALMYKTPKVPTRSKAALDFFRWAFRDGQKRASDLGFAALPRNVSSQIEGYWKAQFANADGL
jgi:predicted PurR-regulated permease PerM